MALRRDVVELVGGFDESLDAGTPTRSGGDHEMFSRILARWFGRDQAPARARALTRRPGAPPLDLILAELAGCARGPFAWWKSRRSHAASSL